MTALGPIAAEAVEGVKRHGIDTDGGALAVA